MENATLKQAGKIIDLVDQKGKSCEELQDLLGSGLLSDLLEVENPKAVDRDAFRKFISLKPLNPSLLEPLGTIKVPATEKFVAREKFVEDTSPKARVKISYHGKNFKKWFLDKIEEPRPESTLRYAKLTRYSVDRPILAELGNTAETMLAKIYALMEIQPNGEDGALLTNGYANIFYVYDVNGKLRAVLVYWLDDGWDVLASSVEHPYEWSYGYRVFSLAIPEKLGFLNP